MLRPIFQSEIYGPKDHGLIFVEVNGALAKLRMLIPKSLFSVALLFFSLISANEMKAAKAVAQVPKAAEVAVRNPNFAHSSSSSSRSRQCGGCHRRPQHNNNNGRKGSSSDDCCDPCADKPSCSDECCPDFKYEAVFLQHDVGFYSVDFPAGNSDAVAFRSFYLNYPFPTQFLFTDCFCSGDSFNFKVVVQNGDVFSYATTDTDFDNACTNYDTNPMTCYFGGQISSQWAFAQIELPAGFINITIIPRATPYLAGTAYILLQKIDNVSEPICDQPGSPLYPCVWSIFD